ncbi:hypothetical protein D9M72_503800 [compost metagenome]
MHHFAVRHTSCSTFGADTLQQPEALYAQQEKAEHGAEDNETKRCKHTDFAADDHKTCNLDEWHCQYGKGCKGRGHVCYDLMLICVCNEANFIRLFYSCHTCKNASHSYKIETLYHTISDRYA